MTPSCTHECPFAQVTAPLAAALVVLSQLAAMPAAAWDRIEKEIAAEVAGIRRAPGAPEAELAVLEILARYDKAGPAPVRRALEEVADLPGPSSAARERARLGIDEVLRRTGEFAALDERREERGFIERWQVAGPFPDQGPEGHSRACPCPAAAEPGTWREVPADAVVFGLVRASALSARTEESCLCLEAAVEAGAPGAAVLGLGPEGAFTAWWNGETVLSGGERHAAFPDRLLAPVTLRPGENRLVVRLCADERGRLGLFARVTPPRAGAGGRARGSIEELRARARGPRAGPAERHAAARYLLLTGALDPASHEARDLARTACLGRPAADRCLTWALLSQDRNERRRAIEAALETDGDSLPALSALARLELEGPDPWRARAPVRRMERAAPGDPETVLLGAMITAARGLPITADARAREAVEAAPGSPEILAAARDLAREAGLLDRAAELTGRLGALGAHLVDEQLGLAEDALARSDGDELDRRLELLLWPGGAEPGALASVAFLLEGGGDLDGAERLLGRRIEMAPDDPAALRDLAAFLLRRGERDRALGHIGRALELRPQDDRIADYLGFATGGEGFADPWIVPADEFPDTAVDQGHDAACLVDNTVVWLHPSGLASRFRQLVWRVDTTEAARELRRHAIQFIPDSQRLRLIEARVLRRDGRKQRFTGRARINVSEPWYRLYYDIQAEIVELPALGPGDIVEIRYQIDDIAHRNVYNDYFGDMAFAQGDLPKALWRYVVISPPGVDLEFRPPSRVGPLSRREETKDGRETAVFELRDVPRCRPERGLPGLVAACDYFHVSTYRSWDELGLWYQDLIRDQLIPDDSIRETARGLTEGLDGARDKVVAIHNWVVSATRYVGLAFGIHGYKPYRAAQVAARGFGDCKDKAALLVAALREVGVEAEFALVRTRHLGEVEQHPPSLAVFDHAVVYVPELDLWLDGTAETSGTAEFPFLDQGVLALRMTPGGPLLTRTPVLPPEADRSEARLTVTLDRDGAAAIEAEVEIAGNRAAAYRAGLAAEETLRTRFEALLVKSMPGARLESVEFESLEELERPVRYRYEAGLADFARRDGERLLIPVDPGLDLLEAHGAVPDRSQPLEIGPRRVERRTASVTLPEGWSVEYSPPDVELETRFGRLMLNFKKKDETILINRTFILDTHLVSAADSKAFIDFCRRVDEALAAEIIIGEER